MLNYEIIKIVSLKSRGWQRLQLFQVLKCTDFSRKNEYVFKKHIISLLKVLLFLEKQLLNIWKFQENTLKPFEIIRKFYKPVGILYINTKGDFPLSSNDIIN